MIFFVYIVTVIIAYIVFRYINIINKDNEPQGISFLMSLVWPFFLFIVSLFKLGNIVDNYIQKIINK